MLTGTNLLYTKQYNLRIVHEAIRLFGPISRAEVARRTALTGQTISNLVKELLALGLIYEAERRQEGRGAPATALAINPDGAFSIGLDLDRDHLTGVLVDLAGTVRQRVHVDVEVPTPAEALELMVDTVGTLVERQALPREKVWGVGIGIPGPMRQVKGGAGYLVNPKAFPGWHDIPLAQWMSERLALPIHVENNATAAAVGERWYGDGQQIGTFFYVYFGSGLGGGIVMNGRPYEGFTGNAGEIVHLAAAFSRRQERAADDSHVGLLFNLPLLYERLRARGADVHTPERLAALHDEGHPELLAWLDAATDRLCGLALAVEYLLDPEAVFFGGRLPERIIAALMDRVAREIPARRVVGTADGPRHLLARAGADAAALGVATLPIYQHFAPGPQLLMKERKRGTAAMLPAPTRPVGAR